jgi:glycosyltransferase involved in cell wall biosynthesis
VSLDIYQYLGKDFIEKNRLKFVFIGPVNKTYFDEIFMAKLDKLTYKDRVTILPAVPADELVEVYNGTDLCLWPRETTLSSIHAQVCGRPVIMEDHVSNIERVVDRSFLFKKASLKDAATKLTSAIESVKQGHIINISELDEREYNAQLKKMLNSWQHIIAQKLSIK